MNENLDWTRDLGDAVLDQKTELLDAVQRMRGKAYEAGNLKTTEQQVVTQQPDKIIVIESKNPEVVYVPTYSPIVVYGRLVLPNLLLPAHVRSAAARLRPDDVRRGNGVGRGDLGGGCNWGWGHSDIDVDDQPQLQLQPQHEHQPEHQPRQRGGNGARGSTTPSTARA